MGDAKDDGPAIGTVMHLHRKNAPDCPKCGAPPSEQEVRDHNPMWGDGNVHCTQCGTFVRYWDSG